MRPLLGDNEIDSPAEPKEVYSCPVWRSTAVTTSQQTTRADTVRVSSIAHLVGRCVLKFDCPMYKLSKIMSISTVVKFGPPMTLRYAPH